MTGLDRPRRRPGAVEYALRRLAGMLRPPVDVYEPGRCTVHWGPDRPARLLVPVIATSVSGS
jgi:hypothetical protein